MYNANQQKDDSMNNKLSTMNRRDFARLLTIGSGTALLGGLAACSKETPATTSTPAAAPATGSAPAAEPIAGIDYKVLQKPIAAEAPAGKALMIEFFGYWCPHCANLAPTVEAWRKQAPAEIHFEMIPVNFGTPAHEALQRLYFALRDTNKLEAMHLKVFQAIHRDKVNLSSDTAVLGWASAQPELKDSNFAQAYNGFNMAAEVTRANQLVNAYEIDGVPSFGVAGKYFCNGTLAKSLDRALQIAESLAVKEAKSKG